MKYEEIKDKIGTYWTANSLGIYECLGIKSLFGEEYLFNSVEEAREHLKQQANCSLLAEERRIEGILESYYSLPIHKKVLQYLFGGGWKIKKILKEKQQERELKFKEKIDYIGKIKTKPLDRDKDWKVRYLPEIGDKFYVSVIQQNSVPVGIYEYTVEDNLRFRFSNDKGEVFFSSQGSAHGITGSHKVDMNIEYGEHGLRNGWAYHHVFESKQEAIDHLREHVSKMIENYTELLEGVIDVERACKEMRK